MVRKLVRYIRQSFLGYVDLFQYAVREPREVLLMRCHHQWTGAAVLAVTFGLYLVSPFDPVSLTVLLVFGGSSWALDLVASSVHWLWRKGWLWKSIACPCCGPYDDGPDDGEFDDDPDEPGDDHGLTPDDEAWLLSLASRPAPTH